MSHDDDYDRVEGLLPDQQGHPDEAGRIEAARATLAPLLASGASVETFRYLQGGLLGLRPRRLYWVGRLTIPISGESEPMTVTAALQPSEAAAWEGLAYTYRWALRQRAEGRRRLAEVPGSTEVPR